MPYEIMMDIEGCSGHAVVKEGTTDIVPGGCHPTHAEAEDHLTALNIALSKEKKMQETTLPQPVLDRLGEDVDKITSQRNTRRGKVDVEVRAVAQAPTLTANENDQWNLRGYATVYDHAYPIAGGPENGGWMEIVERGATSKSIKDGADVRLLFDHDGIPLARTASGTMRLISDDMGMMVDADLDVSSPYAQSVRSAILRGDADQMSFAFRVLRQQWNEDYTERRIKEVQLFDASVVTYPASAATVVQMNNSETDAQDETRSILTDMTAEDLLMLASALKALEIGEEEEEDEEDDMSSEKPDMGQMRSMPLSTAKATAEALRNK